MFERKWLHIALVFCIVYQSETDPNSKISGAERNTELITAASQTVAASPS